MCLCFSGLITCAFFEVFNYLTDAFSAVKGTSKGAIHFINDKTYWLGCSGIIIFESVYSEIII
jgi:hypothetical protein